VNLEIGPSCQDLSMTAPTSGGGAPEVWLVRHGETEWSRDHKHTSVTDLPLTPAGVGVAGALARRLAGDGFDLVLTSPRVRARRTAELAGFADARVEVDLVEWDYGDYEGITTQQIRETVPGWSVWTHPTPGGESADEVTTRLDRVVAETRSHGGRVLLFGHGHALRALAARWIGRPVDEGRYLRLDTATVSVLGYERETPVILRWNA
jgi:probable phosphoglycerate mutase